MPKHGIHIDCYSKSVPSVSLGELKMEDHEDTGDCGAIFTILVFKA